MATLTGTAMGSRHVALLRGINVGRAKRVAMADLRALLEDLGYRDCRTLLNSGNVVFTGVGQPKSIAARIERALPAKLGVSSRVTVLRGAEFSAVVKECSLKTAADPTRLLVAFLTNPADRTRLRPLARQDWKPEAFALGSRAAYLWCPPGVLESRLPEAVGKVLGEAITTRNWATVMKIHALL